MKRQAILLYFSQWSKWFRIQEPGECEAVIQIGSNLHRELDPLKNRIALCSKWAQVRSAES